MVEQVLQTISNNSAGIGTAIQEGFQGVENCNVEKGKIDTNANKIKQHISTLLKKCIKFKEASLFSILQS